MKPQDLPDNLYFGGGAQESIVAPVALCLVAVCLILTLVLPRKYAVIPFLIAALLVPSKEVIVIAGFHLVLYRLLILGGLARIWRTRIATAQRVMPRLNKLDKVFVAWALSNALAYTLLWGFGAFTNRLGFLFATLGAYFWLRYLIRDRDDVIRTIKALAVIAFVISIGMLIEHLKGINQFDLYLAGAVDYADVRGGAIRARGPFLHAIIAGTFGTMLVPLFLLLWKECKADRIFSILGIVASTVIAAACASSTPLMTYAAGLLGLAMWPVRRSMRAVRWAIIVGLIALQASMKVPIWFIFARLGGVMGGTGWHRSELIDQFLRNFGSWWLVGTRDNASWGIDMWDCIDAYVKAGVDGGLLTFVLFLSVIVVAYKKIGRTRRLAVQDRSNERLVWAIGASLFANTVAFFGIIYFDQSIIAWYCLLAMISATSASVLKNRRDHVQLEDLAELPSQAPQAEIPELVVQRAS